MQRNSRRQAGEGEHSRGRACSAKAWGHQTAQPREEGGGLADFWQKKGWARRALWKEEDQIGAVEVYHRVWYSWEPGTALPRPGLWGRKGPTDATAAGSGEDYLF